MQGTRVQAVIQEDPTCCGATKPVHHNYWARALEPTSHNYWAHEPQLLSPRATTTEARVPTARGQQQREATAMTSLCTAAKSSPRSLQLEKSPQAATKTQCSQN